MGITLDAIQSLPPVSGGHRYEGLSFSPAGDTLGVAAINTNRAFLLRQRRDGSFDACPHQGFGERDSNSQAPHDMSLAQCGRTELLAVAKRVGVISVFKKLMSDDCFPKDPAFEIHGAQTRLNFSDGVAFVPPHNNFLAVNNLTNCSITFYRRTSLEPLAFDLEPVLELQHPTIFNPDGLNFSRCGRWLAIANHGNHTVAIFRRRNWLYAQGTLVYGPEPEQVLSSPELQYPHSVAFTPKTYHLAVTNSGANSFCVFAPQRHKHTLRWSEAPVLSPTFAPAVVFDKVNAANRMEGGPKGIAIHYGKIAVSSPEVGIRMYAFREW